MIGTGNIGTGLMGPETPTYTSPLLLPASAVLGTRVRVANINAPGGWNWWRYGVNGWRIEIGETLAMVSTEIPLTAAVTAYTQMISWDFSNYLPETCQLQVEVNFRSASVHGGANSIGGIDMNGVGRATGTTRVVSAPDRDGRRKGIIKIRGGFANFVSTGDDSWTNSTPSPIAINMASVSFGMGVNPGTVGDQLVLEAGSTIKRVG